MLFRYKYGRKQFSMETVADSSSYVHSNFYWNSVPMEKYIGTVFPRVSSEIGHCHSHTCDCRFILLNSNSIPQSPS
jgi:hypothetical protein